MTNLLDENKALKEEVADLRAQLMTWQDAVGKYRELLDPNEGWMFEDYHYFMEKEVVEELSKDEEIKAIEGRFLVRIFPPGTVFEPPVMENNKELIEVKLKVW